ncbi:hypothetical protein GmHk_15G045001 [Glycine max]|nr:hypothetical protein GmHk_15G045001 [Glycine max]
MKAQAIQKQNTTPHVLSREGYELLEKKLIYEKKKKQLEEVAKFGSTNTLIDPPSSIRRHVKWKMARTKKTYQMTCEATKEIGDKINSLEEQVSQGSFVSYGCQDLQGPATLLLPRLPRPRAMTQKIKDQLEESITEKDVRMKAQAIQKQNTTPHVLSREGYELLEKKLIYEKKKKQLEEVAKFGSTNTLIDPPSSIRRHVKWKMARTKKTYQMTCEATKEIGDKINSLEEQVSQGSFVSYGYTSDSEKYGLYIEENIPRLVSLGRIYEGSTTVQNITLRHDQVKVGVEEVRDADAPIPVPTQEVQLVGHALNTFVAWPTHLVKLLSEQSNRQKGSTECGYYVMHWMLTITLRNFKNNWETVIV